MKVKYTVEDLKDFEKEVAELYEAGAIRAPIHLEDGNEPFLIALFEELIEEEDWIFCSWRSHLKCLLKGVPEKELLDAITAGKSIGLCFPEYRILSSAIVGGVCPIAVGVALGIASQNGGRGGSEKVICFSGDMTAECGTFLESVRYSRNLKLPITWVVEDNEISTNTPTKAAWHRTGRIEKGVEHIRYRYRSKWPHSGVGKFIKF